MLWEVLRHSAKAVFVALAFLSLFQLIPFSSIDDDDMLEELLNTTAQDVVDPLEGSLNSTQMPSDVTDEVDETAEESDETEEIDAESKEAANSTSGDADAPIWNPWANSTDEPKALANLTEELNESLRRGSNAISLGPLLIPAGWDVESSPFLKWASEFFPVTWPRLPEKDKFLRIVGVTPEAVCINLPDQLDYTIGWQQRSISYLYQSNKTRIQCTPISYGDSPQLEIIDGHLLMDYLNDTVGIKGCTVVFFFSSSCPYCQRSAPMMHSAAVYFPNLRFLAINTDKTPGVAGHYGIMGVPVVVLFHEKKFVTGWTIPYADARDTIRAFIMAYTETKYLPVTQNITGLEEGIMSHFELKKQNSFLYMLSNFIVIGSFTWMFWKKYLLDAIKKALDRAGVNDDRLVLGVQQPDPQGEPVPVPANADLDEDEDMDD